MVETVEAVKGGGGSIKLGTRGTISTLISRELESTSTFSASSSKAPSTSSCNEAAANTPRKLKFRTSFDQASSIQTTSNVEDKKPETPRKTKSESHHRIPMLEADGISVDGTPVRLVKRGVQVVDIKCGSSDKKWVKPITTRLKKLGFSKLSDSVG